MVFAAIVIVLVFTAGTALMMWLGEQINKYGIGNGISILLFAGIIARLPQTVYLHFRVLEAGSRNRRSRLRSAAVLCFCYSLGRSLPRCCLDHHLYAGQRKKDPHPVRKACSRQKDVRRSVQPPSHQGCARRRTSHHLRQLHSFHSEYDQPVRKRQGRLLGRVLQCV